MEFSYQKNNNVDLFESFMNFDLLNMSHVQNYIPLYRNFFSLNETNFNHINLNHSLKLTKVLEKNSENKYLVVAENKDGEATERNVFFKLIPLIDPTKYITSKYDSSDNNLLKLPSFIDDTLGSAKVRDSNNAAYVDSFFTYLTSFMLHECGFIHGVNFYGSYLGMKNDFMFNVVDDIEYLRDCKSFHENRGVLYNFDSTFQFDLMNRDTRDYKEPITFSLGNDDNNIALPDIEDMEIGIFDGVFAQETSSTMCGMDISTSLLYDSPDVESTTVASRHSSSTTRGSSRCSSRSSNTSVAGSVSNKSEYSTECSSMSIASEDAAFIKIQSFPIQVVALEQCEQTLDAFITSCRISDEEYGSIVAQIIMILITYQKVFGLTHNDLHTNNIMYVKTDRQYVFYKHDGRHYKVPTFGKVYKIIDYGRAIYKFRGTLLCSDSYHPKGDAATQYNFEPYFDSNKARVEPNFSFDLCRLGCALYDMLMDGLDDEESKKSPIVEIMTGWCLDDKGRNILYKNNGEERYPDFKLYKMIARTVHNHMPCDEIKNSYFEKYHISKKKINKQKVMNLDILVSYQ